MIFIYAILVPRYLALTGSTASTVILGGLTYTLLHVWDAWTVFSSPASIAPHTLLDTPHIVKIFKIT